MSRHPPRRVPSGVSLPPGLRYTPLPPLLPATTCEGCGAPPEPGWQCSYCKRLRWIAEPGPYRPPQPSAIFTAVGVISPNEARALRSAWERHYSDRGPEWIDVTTMADTSPRYTRSSGPK